jgi:GT2 family glycosyltransferase
MLDERFFMYAEETDWCYRFKQAGFKIMFTPEAEIIHLHGASSRKIRPEMILQLRGSILLFLKKHRGRMVYSVGCLLVALFFLLRVPYWVVYGIVSTANRQYGFETALTYLKGIRCALTGWRGLCVQR